MAEQYVNVITVDDTSISPPTTETYKIEAHRLATDKVGDATHPVYFDGGVPVQCSGGTGGGGGGDTIVIIPDPNIASYNRNDKTEIAKFKINDGDTGYLYAPKLSSGYVKKVLWSGVLSQNNGVGGGTDLENPFTDFDFLYFYIEDNRNAVGARVVIVPTSGLEARVLQNRALISCSLYGTLGITLRFTTTKHVQIEGFNNLPNAESSSSDEGQLSVILTKIEGVTLGISKGGWGKNTREMIWSGEASEVDQSTRLDFIKDEEQEFKHLNNYDFIYVYGHRSGETSDHIDIGAVDSLKAKIENHEAFLICGDFGDSSKTLNFENDGFYIWAEDSSDYIITRIDGVKYGAEILDSGGGGDISTCMLRGVHNVTNGFSNDSQVQYVTAEENHITAEGSGHACGVESWRWTEDINISNGHLEGTNNSLDNVNSENHVEGLSNSIKYLRPEDWLNLGQGLPTPITANGELIDDYNRDYFAETPYPENPSGEQGAALNNYAVFPQASHVEGICNKVHGSASHAEGVGCVAGLESIYSGYDPDTHLLRNYTYYDEYENSYRSLSACHAEGVKTLAIGYGTHAEGKDTIAGKIQIEVGDAFERDFIDGEDYYVSEGCHAEGYNTFAYGDYSHAEGLGEGRVLNTAIGEASHVEGVCTCATGRGAHAEGGGGYDGTEPYYVNLAAGDISHAEGNFTSAFGGASHSEGFYTCAGGYVSRENYETGEIEWYYIGANHSEGVYTCAHGYGSHAEGSGYLDFYGRASGNDICTAFGNFSHAEGCGTHSYGEHSHSEGFKTSASGQYSHAEGIAYGYEVDYETYHKLTQAIGEGSHAEGCGSSAIGKASHSEGFKTCAVGDYSHSEGSESISEGAYSHAEGFGTSCNNPNAHSCGQYNAAMVTGNTETAPMGTAFVIGNGFEHSLGVTRSNAFSIGFDGNGSIAGSLSSGGGDYAEYFEWSDKNKNAEDRIGKFVTIEEDKIRIANSEDDYILGITSAGCSILGNGDCGTWTQMYLKDEFGRDIMEEGHKKINPEYDASQSYISRAKRPEWAAVGMLGVIPVIDDGTCVVGKYCKVNDNGIATYQGTYNKNENYYRVIERVSDNVIKVIFK